MPGASPRYEETCVELMRIADSTDEGGDTETASAYAIAAGLFAIAAAITNHTEQTTGEI